MRKFIFTLTYITAVITVILCLATTAFAQTPGLIYKPAVNGGNKILDPNGDGYVSLTNQGFPGVNLDEGASYSEIPYKPFPVFMDEPLSDLGTGAKFGHTDFAPKGTGSSPLAAHFDGTHFLFRVRLGGQSTASKGYSILIDANNTLNSTGKNPGFEYEVVLATNFDVRVYYHGANVNASPVVDAAGPIIFNGSVDQYSQKAVAASMGGGDPDYFYDFYVPISAFNGAIPITATTPLRMTGVTVTSAKSGLFGVASDIGGVDDTKYSGNLTGALRDLIVGYPTTSSPTDIQTGPFPTVQAVAPQVNSPIYTNNTSITGTSVETPGSVITLYKNGTILGSTTVGTNGTWTFLTSSNTLVTGDVITATVSPTGKTTSPLSTSVTVQQVPGSVNGCTTQPPAVTALTNSEKDFSIITSAAGRITIYYVNSSGQTINYGYRDVTASGSHLLTVYNIVINSGSIPVNGKFPDGTYHFTLTAANGGCTSGNSNSLCSSSRTVVTPPTISPATISTQNATVTVTGPAGSTLILIKNGIQITSKALDASATSWPFNVTGLVEGDVLQARATIQETGGGCTSTLSSDLSSPVTVRITSVPPTITGSYCGTTTTISGTSTEAPGTEIRIYRNGVLIPTPAGPHAYVNTAGQWTATGFTTLVGGESITATAKAPNKAASALSGPVTISTAYVPSVLSINSTPAVVEGNTSVSGKAPAGSTVTLYINGEPYRDNNGNLAPVMAQSGDVWAINNISPFELYAGAKLTIKATAPTGTACESASSTQVEVQCKAPNPNITPALSAPLYCPNTSATVNLPTSEAGIVYSLYKKDNTLFGYSVLGTGKAISLTSYPVSVDNTVLIVKTIKVGANCSTQIGGDLTVSLYPPVKNDFNLSATNPSACAGQSSVITVAGAETIYSYQLINSATKARIGSAVVPTANGNISFPALTVNSNTVYSVIITRLDGGCIAENENTKTVTITRTGPSVTGAVTPANTSICINTSASFSFMTESGYTYSLIDKSTDTQVGSSIAGNGSTMSLSTGNLSAVGTKSYRILVTGTSCTSYLVTEPNVTVTNGPAVPISAGSFQTVCGTSYTLQGSSPAPGTGKWTVTSKPAGAPAPVFSPNDAQPNAQVTGLRSGTYEFTWAVTTTCGSGTFSSSTVSITVNCPASPSVRTTKFIDEYLDGEILATISDSDGGIGAFIRTSGILPPGTQLDIVSNEVVLRVVNNNLLYAGGYTFNVQTTDAAGSNSVSSLFVRMYDRGTAPAPLPVQLVNFSGKTANGQVQLYWATASETDNDRFEIERSKDGKNFTMIGTVKGNGNSSQMLRYEFTDKQPGAGTVYYRLKQIDTSDAYIYSKIIALAMGQVAESGVAQAYPNPFSTDLHVMVTVPAAGEVTLEMVDIRGKVVYSDKRILEEGANEVDLSLKPMSTGVYFLKLTGTTISTTIKVLKTQ